MNITMKIDSELYQDFLMAIDLSNETQDIALERCIRQYIARAFSIKSQKYNSRRKTRAYLSNGDLNEFYGKANDRIPKWARKPEQYNHKIIRAYFAAEAASNGEGVTLSRLEQFCYGLGMTNQQFYSNYHQMKADGSNTHGKVFEDNGCNVWIWEEVKDTLLQYKDCFLN